jgi:hypothetical protein
MDFVGTATYATPSDFETIAAEIGVPFAAFRAVIEVEAGGRGFDKANRPKALFERHHFHKWLKNKPDQLAEAISANLAYPKWGTLPYPKGSDGVYKEIIAACDIDEEAALLSTSWGLGQVMGSNFKIAGCVDVIHMVQEAMESEAYQLRHMANFIKNAGLLDELKDLNWAGFAHGYNGPAYAQNKYDEKLAAAYEKYA